MDRQCWGGARVLVVEDDFLILMELETILDEAGACRGGFAASLRHFTLHRGGGERPLPMLIRQRAPPCRGVHGVA
jgi:hypothetical protein